MTDTENRAREVLLRTEHLKKYFTIRGKDHKKHQLHAVDDISLSIDRGEIFGVVGESGSGKSTLGRCILQLIPADSGEVYFREHQLTGLDRRQLAQLREKLQMVFQNPFSSFDPRQKLGSAIMEIADRHCKGQTRAQKRQRMLDLLKVVGLGEDVAERYPRELSGGQLQRFAILRALYLNPEFIVADEAVSSLDVSVQAQILNLLKDLRDEFDLTILMISHDLSVVEHLCDRVMVMYLGAVMELADAEELFGHTLHPYTKALLAAKPREYPDEVKEEFVLGDSIPSAVDIPACCRFHQRCPYAVQGVCDCRTPEYRELRPGHFVACHFPLEENEKTED